MNSVSIEVSRAKKSPRKHRHRHSNKHSTHAKSLNSAKPTGTDLVIPLPLDSPDCLSFSLDARASSSPTPLFMSLLTPFTIQAQSTDHFFLAARDLVQTHGDTIVKVLSTRSFSVVFETFCPTTQQKYVIKVVKSQQSLSELRTLQRFADTLAKPLSPLEQYLLDRVPIFYGCWSHENLVAMRIEQIEGVPFSNMIKELSESRYIPIFLDLLIMLHHLHSTFHIIHRDIKPENIIVRPSGRIALVDWGSSASLEAGHAFFDRWGSWAYAAPEVYRGLGYGYPADIWSAGIILYLLATKTLPLGCESSIEFSHYILALIGPPEIPSALPISRYISEIIKQLLQPDPICRCSAEKAITMFYRILPRAKNYFLLPQMDIISSSSSQSYHTSPVAKSDGHKPLKSRTRACRSPKFQIDS